MIVCMIFNDQQQVIHATIDGVTVSAEVIYSLSASEQANAGTCLDYLTYITLG